jgi:hypothetical protein
MVVAIEFVRVCENSVERLAALCPHATQIAVVFPIQLIYFKTHLWQRPVQGQDAKLID